MPDAPRAGEIVFVLAMAKGPRVHARMGGLAASEVKGRTACGELPAARLIGPGRPGAPCRRCSCRRRGRRWPTPRERMVILTLPTGCYIVGAAVAVALTAARRG